MMKLVIALVAAGLLTAPSLAAPCKDAKGKFIKCPPAAAAPPSAAAKPSSGIATAASGGKVSAPDKSGHCHVVDPAPGTKQKKGQFVSCPK